MEATEFLKGPELSKEQKKMIKVLSKAGFKLNVERIQINTSGFRIGEFFRSKMVVTIKGLNYNGQIEMYY